MNTGSRKLLKQMVISLFSIINIFCVVPLICLFFLRKPDVKELKLKTMSLVHPSSSSFYFNLLLRQIYV